MIPAAGSYLSFHQAQERMGRALMMHLWLAYGYPLQGISTIADLKAVRDEVLNPTDYAAPNLARIGTPLEIWAWDRFLIEEESPTCVRPDSVAADKPGRWLRQNLSIFTACGTARYLNHIEYCDPALGSDLAKLLERSRAKAPAVFIMPGEDDPEEASQTKAEYRVWMSYKVVVLTENWRGGVTARFEPPLSMDTSTGPGVDAVCGDIRTYCVSNPTLEHTRGLLTIALGRSRPERQRGVERLTVRSLDLRMRVNVTVPNVPCELLSPSAIWVQLQDELGRVVGTPNQVRLSA